MGKIGEPLNTTLTDIGYDQYVERRLDLGESEIENKTGYSYEEMGDFVGQGEYVVLRPTTSTRNVIRPTGTADKSLQIVQEDETSLFIADTANGRIGIGKNMSAPAVPLDISTNSNTDGIRIRGVVSPSSDTGENASATQAAIDGDWINLANVEIEDSVDAGSIVDNSTAEFSDFSFSGIGLAVVGIELKIVAHTNNTGAPGATIDNIVLSWDGGITYTSAKSLGTTLGLSDVTYTVGGSTDTWGRSWSISNFSDANFRLRLDNQNVGGVGNTLIDFIAITVHHGGSVVSTTQIADIYVGDVGNLILDLTPGNSTSQYLDIRPEDNEYGMVLRESDGTGTTVYANFYVVDGSTDYLSINVSATTTTAAFNITSDNNVGIGTAVPGAKLHVLGTNSLALRLEGAASDELADFYMGSVGQLVISTTAGSDSAGLIELRTEDNVFGLILRESDGTGTATYANFYVVDAASDYLSIKVTGETDTDALNITAGDDVGIGTAVPGAKFHINGLVDEIQQITEAHSTQTSNLSEWRDSSSNIFTHVLGGGELIQYKQTVAKTSGYTATVNDETILCDATSAGFTVTLPAVSGNAGLNFHIKKIDSSGNTVTADANSSELIDGATTAVLTTQYESIHIVCDGSAWHIV